MTHYMRWLEAERGLALRRLRRALAAGRSTSSRPSGPRSGSTSRCAPRTARTRGSSPSARCRARSWFEGAELNYAEHVFRGQRRRRGRGPPRLRAARARRAELGRAAPQVARRGRRPARARASAAATASSPTCRTSRRRSSPSSPPPRSARSGRAARPTSAPAASSTASPRSSPRCCSPSTATATAARTSTASTWSPGCRGEMPSLERTVVVPYLDPEPDLSSLRATPITWDELLELRAPAPSSNSSACPSTTRSGSSTPREPPACRRRSSRATAGSCSST